MVLSRSTSWSSYQSWLKEILLSSNFPKSAAPNPDKFSTDSRQIKQGDWFVPLVGENFDGHSFIKDSISKGASGFFYSSSYKNKLDKTVIEKGVEVTDTLKALQSIAKGWRKELNHTKIIALTGSTGKTTTKEMTGLLLQNVGKTYFPKGSLNNEIGVPLSLLKLTPDHRYTVLEFGARHEGDISFLTSLSIPDVVACLNVGIAHLGEFKTMETIAKTKLEIFSHCKKDAVLVAFFDDPRILAAAKKSDKKFVSFGLTSGADVFVKNATFEGTGHQRSAKMIIDFEIQGKSFLVSFPFAHSAYPVNLAASIAMALAADVDSNMILKSLQNLDIQNVGGGGRFNIVSFGPLTLIDDCYNANPDSMKAGLETLSKLYPKDKKILVIGEMLELGAESEKLHRTVGEICASIKPSFLITVGAGAKAINQAALKKGINQKSTAHFENVEELISSSINPASFGNIIFVKGSNGVKLSKYVAHLKTK